MPEPTIKRGSDHFFNVIYEGNGGGQKVGKFIPFVDQSTLDKGLLFNVGDNPKLSRTITSGGEDELTQRLGLRLDLRPLAVAVRGVHVHEVLLLVAEGFFQLALL